MRLLFIGGQDGVNEQGQIISDDLAEQMRQIFRNLELLLRAAGGRLENIIKWTIFAQEGTDPRLGFGVFQEVWDRTVPPPVITVAFVSSVGVPGALVEIEAVAAIPM
jgi:enamine deaminase RidA (YjgF/YER057c/UK114 family)